ncbi:hypothetical protein TNCT_712611 [Trichonephila clavata]|uniref:Uncharacterized protein n=1 Tax=Trichonephila clavata TaxID=2740835 RepID=A0A8X6LN31_TRICU|nr:hypothetical protein TNCT_712611 [Trichonephila clavata]
MASQPDSLGMEQSPIKSPNSPLQRFLCEQQAYAKTQLERMRRIKKHKLAIVEELKSYSDHEGDNFYLNTVEELQDLENSLTIAVSDFDSLYYPWLPFS